MSKSSYAEKTQPFHHEFGVDSSTKLLKVYQNGPASVGK